MTNIIELLHTVQFASNITIKSGVKKLKDKEADSYSFKWNYKYIIVI